MDNEILGIRNLARQSYWQTNDYWLIPTIIVVVILIALAIYFTLRKRPTPPPSPYAIAQQKLQAAKKLLASTDDRQYSSSISDLLRQYIEASFALNAAEQTTEEFLEAAKSESRISTEAEQTLGEFLKLCDLAKFAQHAFGPNDRQKLWDTAATFVEEAEKQIQVDRKAKAIANNPVNPIYSKQ